MAASTIAVDGSQFARQMVVDVSVSPIFGLWNWRLMVARPLLMAACWVLRCQLEIGTEK